MIQNLKFENAILTTSSYFKQKFKKLFNVTTMIKHIISYFIDLSGNIIFNVSYLDFVVE